MSSWVSGSRSTGGEEGEASTSAVKKGFVSAAKIYHDDPTNDDDDEIPHRGRPMPAPKRKRRRLNQDPPSPADDEPETALASPPKSSPHKNRFLAATAALHSPAHQQTTLTGEPPVLLPAPAQARRSKSRRRTKTLLPLETVPDLAMH